MSVFFAAARSAAVSPVARVLARLPVPLAANDLDTVATVRDEVLHAALRHFAAHGLGAAHAAYHEAARLRHEGDQLASERWSAICRVLDRRLGDALTAGQAAELP